MSKLKVNYYLKGDKKQEELTAIYGRIKLEASIATFSTGQYITAQRWHETNCLRNALRKDNERSVKEHLDMIRLKLDKTYIQLAKGSDTGLITAENVKNGVFDTQPKKQVTLLAVIDKHNAYFKMQVLKEDRADGSLEKYCDRKVP